MKKKILVIAVLLVMLTVQSAALASNFYIIPDSNTRKLTEAELKEWQYDALGYILNEIFARYGMPFKPDGKYYHYFNNQSWYTEDPDFTYDSLNSIEWDNEKLVKDVLAEMRKNKDYNKKGKAVPKIEPQMDNIPWGFTEFTFTPGEKYSVYSGPGDHYVRGANGKAAVSTNGNVYVYGWDSGWLLILYRLDSGGGRIGYIDGSKMTDTVNVPIVAFSHETTNVLYACSVTDDPVVGDTPLAKLDAGAEVTFLCWMQNDSAWAYVEANTSAGTVRGCIPADAVDIPSDSEGEDAS